ncbi:MAG TPA: sodium/proline symporter [Mariprofundaceae bacterium]|nr:sodium/proline symporter [Mariprofundaceae bacterium]
MTVASFLFFLLIFAVIGWFSMMKSRHSTVDYLVAGRDVAPWLAGLSAVATNNSGYMFIGMIGLTYTTGLSSIWLMIGWIIGDFMASVLMMKQVRVTTEKQDIHSFGGLMAQWHHTDYNILRRMSGLLTIIFLGSYAAAQFNAGSKALHVLFGWDLSTGAIIGAVLVLLYSFSGGLRASIWTDAAQSFVMIISMAMMMWVAVDHIGNFHQIYTTLAAVKPHYMDWLPHTSWLGVLLFVAGWVFAGFGVAGQPHIVIRYMTLDKPENINRFRAYYYAWFVAFYSATIVVGLLARILLPDAGHFDAELALPMLSMQLLPHVLVGLMLAGLFAATMSTADSLILSCSAALTRDLLPEHKSGYGITKMATGAVVLVALAIAISGNKSVFDLVLIAWGLLASAFVPVLAVYALGGKPSERLAITMMLVGIGVFLLWRELGLSHLAYEVMPAMLSSLFVFVGARKFPKLLR